MLRKNRLTMAVSAALGMSAAAVLPQVSSAQELPVEEVIVTGSRITQPGMVSASPITSISEETIDFFQQPQIEKVLRALPSTTPGDGGNVNNGTAGASTVNLRGLGSERTLILMNGKRMIPFNYNGEVDVSVIPSSLIERIDVVTGGASAVYGSDAVAGAVNFILKNDFEGLEISGLKSQTGDDDGDIDNVSVLFGSNFANDKGNMVLAFDYYNREGILFGDRPLGLLGIGTASGANFQQFLDGEPPVPAPAGCGGPGSVVSGGSTTAIPTRFAILGGGAAASGQFREDGTIGTECSVFNFNPFNYYQTPQERYTAAAFGNLEITQNVEVYGSMNYANTSVVQQVAPSGTFGQPFNLPLRNPLIGDQARQFMIDAGNNALAAGLLSTTGPVSNWQDTNGNGVVDEQDYLQVQLRRRTVELGARTERYDTDLFQINLGARGDLVGAWNYDLSFQYGESNRTTVRDGYTNLTNIQNALDTFDGVTCNNGDATCVPIDLFGGFGTITQDMAGYARAIALQQQKYDQTVVTANVEGPVDAVQSPFADSPLLLSFGLEKRQESASLEPDECLKLAPASCQGGAGGNLLPIKGSYSVEEVYFEGYLPIVSGKTMAESIDLEFGFRSSDYNIADRQDTWKLGLNWAITDQLLVRVMEQQAIRAANIGELFSPVVTGLDNAGIDPCSIANAGNIDANLEALCISTGMSPAQVGAVQNFISGQANTISGSDPDSLPDPETATTFTAGFVWSPDISGLISPSLTVDYYDIEIEDVIGEFSAQEVLDACYTGGNAGECAKIQRVAGDLTISGSGIGLLTTNLDFLRAEGIEVGFDFGVGLDSLGEVRFTGMINKYLTQESKSSSFSEVIDCKGFYGTSCDPLPDFRWLQRVSWFYDSFTVSAQWRHMSSIEIEKGQAEGTFEAFREIDSYNYLDLFASYTYNNQYTISVGVDNAADKKPPVVGGEAGNTSFNSGNTFPSNYETLGRVYTVQLTATF